MIKGIDISHHSTLSLNSLTAITRAHELYFCFIKASEGGTIRDAKFAEYWDLSRKSGLLCGAYHFLRPLTDAGQQAELFLDQYHKVSRTGVLPPVVDIEWAFAGSGASKKDQWTQLAHNKRVPLIRTFLAAVEAEVHVKPVIYTAHAFWKDLISPNSSSDDRAFFGEFPLWNVDLTGNKPIPDPWQQTTFKQTHFGELATTQDLFDRLDQDVFRGTVRDMLNLTVPGFTIARGFPKSFIVRDVQLELKAKGLLQDAADGLFGSHTENAVKAFQQAQGLFPNGIVDPQTWNKLL